MKPEPRVVKKISSQFEPHADPTKHVMMCERKARSDQKLGKTKKRLAERKKMLRAEATKNETNEEKEERRKKENERVKTWKLKQKGKKEASDQNSSKLKSKNQDSSKQKSKNIRKKK